MNGGGARDRLTDSESLYPQVYQILRHAVLTRELQPGERMIERKLAKQLGVSRTPVREAIRKLELEGLVKYVPHKGVVVERISPKDVWEIYTIRSVLEGLAARLASKAINSKEIERLEDLMQEMEQMVDAGMDLEDLLEDLNKLHLEFNDIIYKAGRSGRLYKMISRMVDYIVGFTKIGYSVPGRINEATMEHRELLEAIKKKDENAAERIARKHIDSSCNAYFIQLVLTDKIEAGNYL